MSSAKLSKLLLSPISLISTMVWLRSGKDQGYRWQRKSLRQGINSQCVSLHRSESRNKKGDHTHRQRLPNYQIKTNPKTKVDLNKCKHIQITTLLVGCTGDRERKRERHPAQTNKHHVVKVLTKRDPRCKTTSRQATELKASFNNES